MTGRSRDRTCWNDHVRRCTAVAAQHRRHTANRGGRHEYERGHGQVPGDRRGAAAGDPLGRAPGGGAPALGERPGDALVRIARDGPPGRRHPRRGGSDRFPPGRAAHRPAPGAPAQLRRAEQLRPVGRGARAPGRQPLPVPRPQARDGRGGGPARAGPGHRGPGRPAAAAARRGADHGGADRLRRLGRGGRRGAAGGLPLRHGQSGRGLGGHRPLRRAPHRRASGRQRGRPAAPDPAR